jgi:DNA-binding LacI/PurR family transcriptional regulator
MISDSPLPQRRLAGYHAALHEAGIAPNPKWIRHLTTGQGQEALRIVARLDMAKWLSKNWRHNGVTAILAQNDEFAIGIMDAIQEAGLRVPDDISVIGFDGTEESERAKPPLTTIVVPLEKIGATAMELLLRQMREEHIEANVITLPARLQVRASTAKAGS